MAGHPGILANSPIPAVQLRLVKLLASAIANVAVATLI